MAAKPAKISTHLQPDAPLVQDANYRLDATDRQWVDTRQVAVERHLADNLINGYVATWSTLDATSPAVVAGDVVCTAATDAGTVILASHGALQLAGAALGVVLVGAAPGAKVRYATAGILTTDITGLPSGTTGFARVDVNGHCEFTSSFASADYALGTVDTAGVLALRPIGANAIPLGAVTSVSGTAPIVSSGGGTPAISISAATTSAAGSLSALDKTKLDSLTAGAAVASVTGTAPIASSGGATPAISISSASGSAAGSMSAAHYTLVNGATPNPTASRLALRGTGGEAAFAYIAPNLTGLPSTGFVRFPNTGGSVLTMDSSASPGTSISVLSLDGSDGVIIGDATVATARVTGEKFSYDEPSGDTVIEASATSIILGRGTNTTFQVDAGDITIDAKSFSYDGGTAATGVSPGIVAWQARAAFGGNTIYGGGFKWTAGAGGGGVYHGGGFTFDFGAGAAGSGWTGVMSWVETGDGEFLSLRHEAGNVATFTALGAAKFAVADGFSVWDTGVKRQIFVDIDTALELEWLPLLRFGSGNSGDVIVPIITQAKLTGTDGADAPSLTILGATGQDATGGATANSKGSTVYVKGGAPGTGGGGAAGRYGDVRIGNGDGAGTAAGNVYIGDGTASAGSAQGVVVVHDSHASPSAPTGGFILHSVGGMAKVVQQSPQTYTLTYSGSAVRTMDAYTTDPESSAYTGLDNAQPSTPYAKLADLNALRTAYETLRASHDNLLGVVKALVTDLKFAGWIA